MHPGSNELAGERDGRLKPSTSRDERVEAVAPGGVEVLRPVAESAWVTPVVVASCKPETDGNCACPEADGHVSMTLLGAPVGCFGFRSILLLRISR